MKRITKALAWLLCLVMFTSAVACPGEKSASGKISPDTETPQQNIFLTACLHRKNHCSSTKISSDLVNPIFDKEKEQRRLQEAQLIAGIGMQVADIARTQGDLEGLKAKKDPAALQAAREQLAGQGNLNPTADEVAQQAYNTAMAPYGTGSALQQGIQAATAAVQGLAGGDIAKAIAGGSAPYLAEVIHNMTSDPKTGKVNTEANLMAHAVLGAVVAQAQGNSALAGASGAAMGEYIAQQMYPGIKREDLTETQRQTISALATLAAGLAGGVVGDSTADAVAGAQAGKNSSNNNNLILPAPAPVPVPGVPVSPGDQVTQDANDKIASGLDSALKGIGDAIDKATQCSFGRACSEETGDSSANQPNIGKDLTDAEKAELGGSGSGTPGGWEPQDEENARNNASSNSTDKIGKWSVDELSDGAKYTDPASKKGDLTLAGRALQKHGSRPGSAFPSAKGNPSTINEQGQKIVDSILNDPNKTVIQSNTGRYGQVTDIFSSNGQGLRYDAQGKLIGFLEPPK